MSTQCCPPEAQARRKYTICFLFSPCLQNVLLIHKEKPEWQKGLLNGIGGKVEEGETFLDCANREFQEETLLRVTDFTLFSILESENIEIHIFTARATTNAFWHFGQPTDEVVVAVPIYNLECQKTAPNVQWLVPMARNHASGKSKGVFHIYHSQS